MVPRPHGLLRHHRLAPLGKRPHDEEQRHRQPLPQEQADQYRGDGVISRVRLGGRFENAGRSGGRGAGSSCGSSGSPAPSSLTGMAPLVNLFRSLCYQWLMNQQLEFKRYQSSFLAIFDT